MSGRETVLNKLNTFRHIKSIGQTNTIAHIINIFF